MAISDKKKQELNKMFNENGVAWAKQEIKGVRFNREKKQFLQVLVDQYEKMEKNKVNQNANKQYIDKFSQQKSLTRATWILAIATIVLAIITIILVIVTYYR